MVQPDLTEGRLKRIFDEWLSLLLTEPPQSSAAFSLAVDALRHRH